MTLGKGVGIPVTAITFSCAANHFPAVYNLQRHQRPVPLAPCLYSVELVILPVILLVILLVILATLLEILVILTTIVIQVIQIVISAILFLVLVIFPLLVILRGRGVKLWIH